MDKIVWNEKFNIGVDVVDTAHAGIFRMVGKLMELVEYQPDCQEACKESIKFLEDYTMIHFSQEEAYMRSIEYKGYGKHKKHHDDFRDITLVSQKEHLELSDYSPVAVRRFVGVLIGWLTGHIMTEDQAITGNIETRQIYDETPDTTVISNAVNQAMGDIFHLKAELISPVYNGGSIRKGYYYRLCYHMEDGGEMQLLLAMEEQLARRGVGMMLGLASMQKPELVKDAALQILKQFFHHMGKMFKSDANYKICKEEILSRHEFREDFMTRYSTNLLYETRLGYFIFCSRKRMEGKESLSYTG